MSRLVAVPAPSALRLLLRRSKGDDQQTYSLDVQRAGALRFADGLGIEFGEPIEYVSDGVAGDDIDGLQALRNLVAAVCPGDIVICRDHSRLGRDMLESATTIRQIVAERRARLYYYSTGEEVLWRDATDAAMTVLRGFSAQAELENTRRRTAEALRARVRARKLAGGRCYGYQNIQHPDRDGRRKNTTAEIDPVQADVVLRIFSLYADGGGLAAIAKVLNAEYVPTPSHGRRGTGSWAPSAIRAMLLNERYRGVYVHGRVARVRKGGRRVAELADESQVIRVDISEWRIVPEELWLRVQARFSAQAAHVAKNGNPWRTGRERHPLSGLGRCANCGGPITVANTKATGGVRVQAYVCAYRTKRGPTVCDVSVRQPRAIVESAVIGHLLDNVLSREVMEAITARVVELAQAERSKAAVPADDLDAELRRLRAEQKRCARLLATLDDAGELAAEYSARTKRIRAIESDIAAAKAAPAAAELAVQSLADEVTETFRRLRRGLIGAPSEARKALCALFSRLNFEADGTRWAITGVPRLELPAMAKTPTICDPTGSRIVEFHKVRILTAA